MIRHFDPDKWRSKRPAVAVGIPMTATLHRTAVNQFLSLMLRLREDDVFLPCIESAIASEARNTIINPLARDRVRPFSQPDSSAELANTQIGFPPDLGITSLTRVLLRFIQVACQVLDHPVVQACCLGYCCRQ